MKAETQPAGSNPPENNHDREAETSLEEARADFYRRLSKIAGWPDRFDSEIYYFKKRVEEYERSGGLLPHHLRALHRQLDDIEDHFLKRRTSYRLPAEGGPGYIALVRTDIDTIWQTSELGGAYNTTANSCSWLERAIVRQTKPEEIDHYGDNDGSEWGSHWGSTYESRGQIFAIPVTIRDRTRGHENGINMSYDFQFDSTRDSQRFEAKLLEMAQPRSAADQRGM